MPLVPFKKRAALLLAAVISITPAVLAADGSGTNDWNNRGVSLAKAGHFEEAIASLRHALALDPNDPTAQKNLSGILADYAQKRQRQESTEQLVKWLEEAVALDSGNGPAWSLLGDLRAFRQSDLEKAIDAWQRAARVAPSAVSRALADRITRAQRDMLIERGYEAVRSAHFVVKVQEGRALDLNALTQLMERSYMQLKSELGSGPESLTVIVYTEKELKRVAGQRDWMIGLYDGRMRLRGDELTAPLLADLVRHELSHAFLHRIFGYSLPVWVHEGYAQSHESEQAASLIPKNVVASLQSRNDWIPLKWLDGHFQQPADNEDLLRAYAESRLVVQKILDRHGMQGFVKLLKSLSQGQPMEAAFDSALAPWRWSKAQQGIFE